MLTFKNITYLRNYDLIDSSLNFDWILKENDLPNTSISVAKNEIAIVEVHVGTLSYSWLHTGIYR